MNSDTCEKLAVFCAALFGIATCSAVTPTIGILGGGAAVFSLPAVIRSLRSSRETPKHIVAGLKKAVEADWRDWARRSGELTDNQVETAVAALNGVLDLIEPDPQKLMKAGRDNAELVKLVVSDAKLKARGDYAGTEAPRGTNADPGQGDINTRFLRDLLIGALVQLDGNPDFEAALTPWFQREVLERTRRIGETGDDTNERVRRLEAMMAEMLAKSERTGDTERAIEAGVEPAAIINLARRISADINDVGRAFAELERAIDIAIEVQAEARRGSNAGEFVDVILARMAILSAEGRYDDAAAEADKAFAQWQREEEERRDAERQRGLKLLDAGLKQDLLRRDARSAAARIVHKVEPQTTDREAVFFGIRSVQDEWYTRGRDKGLNLDLAVSIEIARLAVDRAPNADEKGSALNDLGIALRRLGERESRTDKLEEALAVCHAALREQNRERVPLDWAKTHNSLGNALAALGEREIGSDRLEKAADAYRAALQEYTRERIPLRWATTQNNLGTVLRVHGERESGTDRLKEAVAAFRAALQEYTREREPLDWAMAQNNLGTALATLGGREGGTDTLKEAVAAFRAALQEYTRDRVPMEWAATQNNLGAVLRTLGTRESGTERLEEAVAAYRAALQERTRERVPLGWAMAQNNLGKTLVEMGRRTKRTGDIEAGKAAMIAAWDTYRSAGYAPYDKGFQQHLAEADALLATMK